MSVFDRDDEREYKDISDYSIAQLIAELATRDGVTQLTADTDECAYSCYAGPNYEPKWGSQCHGPGPAKILVVRE